MTEEQMICVCRRCGCWYNIDMHEALYCHDGDQDWWIGYIDLPEDFDYHHIADPARYESDLSRATAPYAGKSEHMQSLSSSVSWAYLAIRT